MNSASRRLFASAAAAGLIIASVPAGSAPSGIDVPLYRPILGVEFRDSPGPGVEIARVTPETPAALADLRPGDRIVSIDGRMVKSMAGAFEAIVSRPPYDMVEFVLDRQGARLVRKVVLGGKLRLEDIPVAKVFPIPGIDTTEAAVVPDAVEALDRMNVLKRVLIDARTGAVEFIGTYDARYATGPLPYRELLEVGLRHPEPEFSMGEPEPGALDAADKLYAMKEADIERTFGPEAKPGDFSLWLRRWLNLLTGHPLLETERQIYLARHAAVAGLTKGELALITNYVTLHGASDPVPADVLAVQLKILRNLGWEKEAEAYAQYREGTAKALANAARTLGIYEQVQKILEPLVAAGKSNDEMVTAIRAFICCDLMIALNQKSRAQADAHWRDFEQGKVRASGLDISLQLRIVPEWDRAGRPLVYRALNGMPLSNEMLRLFYGVTAPGIGLVFKDVPPESHLGRVLYKADYALKTIENNEALHRTVPVHRAFKEIARGANFGSNIQFRYELSPLEAPLYVSDGGTEVGFGESRMALTSRVAQLPGRKAVSPEDSAAARTAAAEYALQIQDRYEDYARAYPPLHELRETAKVLALAKWLNAEKAGVRPGAPSGPAWTPPARIPWLYEVYMSFEMPEGSGPESRGTFHIPMAIAGGATFKTAKNWAVLGPRPPSYVPAAEDLTTSAALGERAVQAALGGDLESARELAELSAQAMTGDLDIARLPANAILPQERPRRPATPEEVRMVKEAIRTIRDISSGPSGGQASTIPADRAALLNDVGEALRKGRSDPAAATAFLTRLQTRALSPKPAAGEPVSPPGKDGRSPGPLPFDCSAYLSSFSQGQELGDGRKAFFEARIAEIQDKLGAVRKAMDELVRLRQGDLEALQRCEAEISGAFEDAQARALDAMSMLLIGGPSEILGARRGAVKRALDRDIMETSLIRKTVLGGEEMARLDGRAFALLRMKYAFEGIYGRAERLQKTLTGAKSLFDMSQWADSDKADLEKIKEGTLQLAEMLLGDEKVGGAFKLGKLTGEGVLRFLSLYKATDAACGFFYDIMKQKFVWEPLVDELVRSLETNRQAVRALQEKARDLQNRLNCLRTGLR